MSAATVTITRIHAPAAHVRKFERHYGRTYAVNVGEVFAGEITNRGANLWDMATDKGTCLTMDGLFIGTQAQAAANLAAHLTD